MLYSLIVSFIVLTPMIECGNSKVGNNRTERTVEIPMATAEDCSRTMQAMRGIAGLRVACSAYGDGTLGDGSRPVLP